MNSYLNIGFYSFATLLPSNHVYSVVWNPSMSNKNVFKGDCNGGDHKDKNLFIIEDFLEVCQRVDVKDCVIGIYREK